MDINPEIADLLRRILQKEVGRAQLANWMATRSLLFLDSPNEFDRVIVTELDVALGEMQRGRSEEGLLTATAKQLIMELALDLSTFKVTIQDPSPYPLQIETGTSNTGASLTYLPPVVAAPTPG